MNEKERKLREIEQRLNRLSKEMSDLEIELKLAVEDLNNVFAEDGEK